MGSWGIDLSQNRNLGGGLGLESSPPPRENGWPPLDTQIKNQEVLISMDYNRFNNLTKQITEWSKSFVSLYVCILSFDRGVSQDREDSNLFYIQLKFW